MTRAAVAAIILDSFTMSPMAEIPEGWFKLVCCETPADVVDDVIDEMLDAEYVASTITTGHQAALRLLPAGARAACGL